MGREAEWKKLVDGGVGREWKRGDRRRGDMVRSKWVNSQPLIPFGVLDGL